MVMKTGARFGAFVSVLASTEEEELFQAVEARFGCREVIKIEGIVGDNYSLFLLALLKYEASIFDFRAVYGLARLEALRSLLREAAQRKKILAFPPRDGREVLEGIGITYVDSWEQAIQAL